MNRDESDKVYDSLCMMLEVANIQNSGDNPPFIVLPRDDLMTLKGHRRAPEWLQMTPKGLTFYGVPIVESELLQDHASVAQHAARRANGIDYLMSLRDPSGRGLMEHQDVILVRDFDDRALRELQRYGREIPEGFDLGRNTFNGRRFEVSTPRAIMYQDELAMRAELMERGDRKRWRPIDREPRWFK